MDEQLSKQIRALYKKGMSLRDIGDKLLLSHETVRNAIPANERRRKRMDQKMIDKILRTFKKTQSFQETAEILDLLNRQVVYRVVARAGLL